ncbi:MAG: GntR family transcriptional regulator, partial [Candidatus Dormibacteraceae bacterium]
MTQATYALIRERVRAQILSGALGPGARLPTEAELQAQYKVSRVTAQQALRDLAREGLITRHRGRGSYLADGLREQNLLRMINFLSAGPELPGDHEVLSARVVPAGDLDLRRVGADAVEPVFDLRRRKRTDGDWVALERTHVPFRLAPHLLDEPL